MRALLPSWMVQDGQIPEMAVGDTVELALELLASERRAADAAAPGMTAVVAPDGRPDADYELTGTVSWSDADARWAGWTLDVDGIPLAVNEHPPVGPEGPMAENEVRLPPPPVIGDRVSVRGTVKVAYGYEWDGIPIAGRRAWTVRGITLLHRPLEEVRPNLFAFAPDAAPIRRGITRMDRWADELESDSPRFTTAYLVDLEPAD